MVLMLLDHVRETFFLHQQLSDPMTLPGTSPMLFFSRVAAHFCAPAFIFLAGLSAWLWKHQAEGSPRPLGGFLVKRGLLVLGLELTMVSFAWTGRMPWMIYLQVMWAIGIAMLVLAAVHVWPRWLLLTLGLALAGGHHLLAQAGDPGDLLWSILLHRNTLYQGGSWGIRLSYPVLPWIGVILLGYCAGPLFGGGMTPPRRIRSLACMGFGCWSMLLLIRSSNLYGESAPWNLHQQPLLSLMGFLNFTKYPPSMNFLLLGLGGTLLALALLERFPIPGIRWLGTLGSAPLFFYLMHLYLLLGLQHLAQFLAGKAERFHFEAIWQLWLTTLLLLPPLWAACRGFKAFKRRHPSPWLRYL
ncbi:MAG: hypothetical protein H6Q00_3201 [Holophagaceae bacterium]|nr:hypothetical protein [Holophagaceae bacterium]